MQVISDIGVQVAHVPAAAGVTELTSDTVDLLKFGGVAFIVSFGTITATSVNVIKIEYSDDDSTWNDLADTGLSVPDTASDTAAIAEVGQLGFRYARCVLTRTVANSVLNGIIALKTEPTSMPVADDATISAKEFNSSPLDGTP